MQKIHLMGISGSGMRGVFDLATKMGYEVTGCDLKSQGHNVNHLNGIDLLVVSPAVLFQSKTEPELVQAEKKGIVITWEEFLAKFLMKDKYVIAIAGTHGKSTTTAMVAKVLTDNDFDPSVLIGAYVPEWNGNSRFGKSKYFVVEADEFNDNFLHYHPDIAVINNIEFDHPDYFKNEKQLNESFNKFVANIKPNGKLYTEKDDKHIDFNLKIMGSHNQKNANMAFQVGRALGISDTKIIKSLEGFKGIGRRMELIKDGNIKIYDDYAHHPTAIKTTLEGLREKYPRKKILAIIEPHGYMRTKALLPLYKSAFDSVDGVVVGPIFKARDKVVKNLNSTKIAKISAHKKIEVEESADDLIKNLKSKIDNYHIMVFMGAGNSSDWLHEFIK